MTMICDKCGNPLVHENPPMMDGKPVCDTCAREYIWDIITDASKYDVWEMGANGTSRRIARCDTLTDARDAITPAQRAMGYVYIMQWVLHNNPIAATVKHTSRYVWGCLDGWAHTDDMRATVRNVLVGAR